jgi:quercetin dioxygenase-like cupin family protein
MNDGHESRGFVLLPGEGRTIDLHRFRMSVKAEGGQTGGSFSLLEAEEPPGFGPPLHIHRDAAEAFYVLEGEYTMFMEEQEVSCPAGSFVFIPAGMVHGFKVGNMASRKLNLYTPAAMVGYFDELSAALNSDHADEGTISAIAKAYSMEVVGPAAPRYTR